MQKMNALNVHVISCFFLDYLVHGLKTSQCLTKNIQWFHSDMLVSDTGGGEYQVGMATVCLCSTKTTFHFWESKSSPPRSL